MTVQNVLIGLAGWMMLATIGGLCIGNALRQCSELGQPDVAPRRASHAKHMR